MGSGLVSIGFDRKVADLVWRCSKPGSSFFQAAKISAEALVVERERVGHVGRRVFLAECIDGGEVAGDRVGDLGLVGHGVLLGGGF